MGGIAETGKREGGTSFAGAGLIVAALVAGVLFREAPFVRSRPPALNDSPIEPAAELVRARLWQDPLEAVTEHKARHQGPGATCSEAEHQDFRTATVEPSQGPLLALVALIKPEAYAEDVESRLRTRYALVSGLAMAGYVPVTDSGISYLQAVSTCSPGENDPGCLPHSDLPFEWYRRDRLRAEPGGHFGAVLVIWLPESDLGSLPLSRVLRIPPWVRAHLTEPWDSQTVRIVGPWSSSTLDAMLAEVAGEPGRPAAGPHDHAHDQIQILSPWATADEEQLMGAHDGHGRAAQLRQALDEVGVHVVRTTASDGQLTDALVGELARYRVDLGDPATDVAIVSEWDTFYGRALPRAFETSATKRTELVSQRVGCSTGSNDSHLHCYSYLRGLDGSVPRSHDEARGRRASPDKTPSATDLEQRREALERPENNGQLDYLRRLAERIDATNARLGDSCSPIQRLTDGCRRIRAIGVLGSDVYDKLLVLQALRPRFPDVVFFTTDLDAVMLHPAEVEWTRNVLVASGFGLALDDTEQRSIPPFRDSYETATFSAIGLAVQKDLQGAFPEHASQNDSVFFATRAPAVRLFEIGRDGAVDVSVPPETGSLPPSPLRRDVATRSVSSLFPAGFLWLGLGTLGILLALPLVARRDVQNKNVRARDLVVLLSAMLAVPAAVVLLAHVAGAGGEPLGLFDGVSVWPTIVIRTYVVGLSLYLSARLLQQLHANAQDIERRFGLNPRTQERRVDWVVNLVRRLWERHLPGCFRISRWGAEKDAPRATAQQRWVEYQDREDVWARMIRVILSTLAFFLMGFLLLGLFGFPRVPARGQLAYMAERFTLYLSVLTVLALNYLVVDATWICARFVELVGKLTDPPPRGELTPGGPQARTDQTQGEAELARLELIEQRTTVVGRFVYYPFVMLCLTLVARSRFFDDWSFPLGLIVILAMLAVYVLVCATILRWAAARARREALERLRQAWWSHENANSEADQRARTQIEAAVERIRNMSGGAFAHWTQHPIVGALLVPSGGLGLLTILDTWYAFR